MPVIQQMPAHLADLIAAGEVVERPGSAAKELIENAIDAGAKNIVVELKNGGMTFLRVTDDGCGMGPADAETAFLRHATSKLRDETQLGAIGTLGFRGEALAAIAAVSKIDLLTREAGSDSGTALHLEAGTVTERGPAGCPVGTTIIVRDLFYNTPARMKYMKRDSSEAANIAAVVQRQALARPALAIRLLKDGQEQLRTPGDGQLRSAVYTVLGRQMEKDMTPADGKWGSIRVEGFVSKPTASRGSRGSQFFFVNGRYIRSKSLTAALEQAYANQLMVNRYPACVLHLTVPLDAVDVNVHPAKTEVKFLTEKDVFDCVYYSVLTALNRTPGKPEMQDRTGMRTPDAAQAGGNAAAPGNSRAVPQPGFYQTMTAEQFRQSTAGRHTSYLQTPAQHRRGGQDAGPQDTAPDPARQDRTPEARTGVSYQMAESSTARPAVHDGGRSLYHTKKPAPQPDAPADSAPRKAQPAGSREPPETQGGFTAGTIYGSCSAAGTQHPRRSDSPPETPAAARAVPAAAPAAACAPDTDAAPAQAPAEPAQQEMKLPARQSSWRIVGEVMRTYIIVEEDDHVLFIDKHAAHERVLFEKFRAQEHPMMAQGLLQPLVADLSREEAAAVLENRELLESFGFGIDDFGDGSVLLRQVPGDLDPAEAERTLQELAGQLLEGRQADPGAVRDELLHTVACKAAIKAGYVTAPAELEALVRQVLERDDIKYCPHGRPVCVTMTQAFLEKQFKRT